MRVQHKALLAEFQLEIEGQKCIIMYMHLKKLSNSYRTELIKKKKERHLSFFNFRLRHYLPRYRTASILFIQLRLGQQVELLHILLQLRLLHLINTQPAHDSFPTGSSGTPDSPD